MKSVWKCAVASAVFVLAACQNDAAKQQPMAVSLQGTNGGDPVTLQIPRGYIEEPKKPEGTLPNVILRIPAKDLEGAAFAAESEVRVLIEPASGTADAARQHQAAALRKPKFAEEAIVKSTEKSKDGLTAYAYPNATQEAEAYYLKSKTGDVFVDCRRSVCSALKTWKKRVHLRVDCQPANPGDVQALDAAIDQLLQSFTAETNDSGPAKKSA